MLQKTSRFCDMPTFNFTLRFNMSLVLIASVLITLLSDVSAQSAPPVVEVITSSSVHKPYPVGKPAFKVTFAPDYVACDIPRRFAIEIEVPSQGFPVPNPQFEDCVRLIDHRELVTGFNPNGSKCPQRVVHRYYFQTVKRSEKTLIRFVENDTGILIPIVIWDFNDLNKFRLVNNEKLPRKFPLHRDLPFVKEQQIIPITRSKGGKHQLLSVDPGRMKNSDLIDAHSFTAEDLWKICPDASAFGLFFGETSPPDPVHGAKIFEKVGAFYSYTIPHPKPGNMDAWYCVSPVDGRRIPDNDIGSGDFHSGTWFDDGIFGLEHNGRRDHFAGQVAYWRGIIAMHTTARAAENYIKTSDPHDLHLALVGLSRLAVEYSYLAAMPQSRRANAFLYQVQRLVDATPVSRAGNAGFIENGIATSAHIGVVFQAYDKIFPYLGEDPAIFTFLQSKGIPVRNVPDLKKFIESGIFKTWMQVAIDGQSHVNYPMTEMRYLEATEILNYPTTELMDVAFYGSPGYWSNGFVYQLYSGGIHRDGMKFESPSGYNTMGGNIGVLDALEGTIGQILNRQSDLFPKKKYPEIQLGRRLVTACETHIQHSTTETTKLYIGDAGGMPTFRSGSVKRQFLGDEGQRFFERSYQQFPEPKIAWALINTEGYQPSAGFPYSLEQLRQAANKVPADFRIGTFLLSGQGIALLRSGKGKNERCVVNHYGKNIGHAGDTLMNFYLDAFGARLVSQWGYPQGWHRWYSSWWVQNTGRPYPLPGNQWIGVNDVAIDVGNLHFSDSQSRQVEDAIGWPASANDPAGSRYTDLPDNRGWQRRMLALVDVNETEFYTVDFYRMIGGKEQYRSFASLDGACEVKGLTLKPVQGRLDEQPTAVVKSNSDPGFNLLTNISSGVAPKETWDATWNINDSNGLKLRLNGVISDGAEVSLCDATEPNKTHNIVRKTLVWHHKADSSDTTQSQVLNVIEAFRDNPVVASARSLPVTGGDERDYTAAGLEVVLNSGRKDYFIFSAMPDSKKTMVLPNGKTLTTVGRVGYISLDAHDKIVQKSLVAGTALEYDDRRLTKEKGVYSSRIVNTDYDNWTITVNPAPKNIDELIGKKLTVIRKAGGHRVAFEVRSAQRNANGAVLTLNTHPVVFTAPVIGVKGRWLQYRTARSFSLTVRLSNGKYFHGTTVRGIDGKVYRVDTATPDGVRLFDAANDEKTLLTSFPAGTLVEIYDYAEGDSVEVPLAAIENN
jgi:hypothetical protein